MQSHRKLRALGTIAVALLSCVKARADGITPGTILGIFSNPVFAGYIANDPSLGQSLFLDNTGTSVYSINNSTNPAVGGTPLQQTTGSALSWGVYNGSSAPGDFSTLAFFGSPIPSNIHSEFQLGTITFYNGTSDLNSLIFGATLSFYDNAVSPTTFLGSDQVIITTTNNVAGTSPTDDDYINICGNTSNICATSIEAVESTEGGNGVTVNLDGAIVGDPMLNLDSVSLAPGQSGTANGFLGSDPPVAAQPEPATWILSGAGALAFLASKRRRKQA